MHSTALFEKKVSSLYAHYLLPTLLAMASNSLYCLADVYFVSKGAGSTALAAMNIAIPLYTIYSAIGLTFGVGAATVMSVAEGEKQPKVRNKAYTYGALGMVSIGLCIAFFGNLFVDDFAYLLGSSEELLPLVKAYMIPVNGMAMAFIVNYAGSVILRNDHAPRLAMIATMAGNFSNIFLDYVFVIQFNMGIFGAAVATAIGPVISLGIMSLHFIRKKNTIHLTKDIFDTKIWKRIFSNGFGSGILEISAGAVIVIFNYVILKKADAMFLAAYAINEMGTRMFGMHSNMPLTQQFAGYALVVSFLLQIVTGLLPDFRIIAWLLQFYIVYVVWEGVPILMGVEEKQRLKYTLLSSVLLILCPAVIQIVFNRLTAILN